MPDWASLFPRHSDSEIKFETYHGYLKCISLYLRDQYVDLGTLAKTCADHTRPIQGFPGFDAARVDPRLKISWNTEYLLGIDHNDIDLIRINNQWTPIQAYYAVSSAAEALAYLTDGSPTKNHETSLRKVTNHFVQNGLPPWNFAYSGCLGRSSKDHHPLNFPPDINVPHNLQRTNVQPVEMIAKCLKAEHVHRVDQLWRRGTGTRKYDFDPGPTGLLHFLFRLRLKSNYNEIDAFVGKETEASIRGFKDNLQFLCEASLMYLEVLIARKCRKDHLLKLVDEYLEVNDRHEALKKRRDLYAALL